jgi:hypothetical protein
MLADTWKAYCPYVANLREYARASLKTILEFAEQMDTDIDALPDDLKPTAQVLTEITMRVLIQSYAEGLKLFSDLGLQEICRAALSPEHQTEKEQQQ